MDGADRPREGRARACRAPRSPATTTTAPTTASSRSSSARRPRPTAARSRSSRPTPRRTPRRSPPAGTDKRGQGGASATIVNTLHEIEGGGTRVDAVTDFTITGPAGVVRPRRDDQGHLQPAAARLRDCLQQRLAARAGGRADADEAAASAGAGAAAEGRAPAEVSGKPPAEVRRAAPADAGQRRRRRRAAARSRRAAAGRSRAFSLLLVASLLGADQALFRPRDDRDLHRRRDRLDRPRARRRRARRRRPRAALRRRPLRPAGQAIGGAPRVRHASPRRSTASTC